MALLGLLWRQLGTLRWPVLWLFTPKFVIGVSAIICNEHDQVWLQQHRFWPDQAWGLPGGLIKSGERPETALAREIREETGLNCEVGELVKAELYFRRGMTLFYRASLQAGDIHLDKREIMAAGYFSHDALPVPLLPSHAMLLEQLYTMTERN